MIYQQNQKLKSPIKQSGCLFLCYCFLAGIDNVNQINKFYDQLVCTKAMAPDCFINSHVLVASALGISFKSILVEPPSYQLNEKQNAIGEYFNKRTNYHHFVVLNQNKTILYDPIEGGSITAKEGELISLRVITLC